jgi:hypothetical protein
MGFSGVKVNIKLDSDTLVMRGPVNKSSTGCILRGVLDIHLDKPTKIKSINLVFSGRRLTSWMQGKCVRRGFTLRFKFVKPFFFVDPSFYLTSSCSSSLTCESSSKASFTHSTSLEISKQLFSTPSSR